MIDLEIARRGWVLDIAEYMQFHERELNVLRKKLFHRSRNDFGLSQNHVATVRAISVAHTAFRVIGIVVPHQRGDMSPGKVLCMLRALASHV